MVGMGQKDCCMGAGTQAKRGIESLKINDPQLQKSITNNAIDASKHRYILMVEANAAAAEMQIDIDAQLEDSHQVAGV